MNSLNNSPFYLAPTNESYLFKVLCNKFFIGHLDKREGGTLIIQTDRIFEKFHGFGVHLDLLNHNSICFRNVKIIYKGISYIAPSSTFIEFGKSQVYPDGEKLYLNIRYFNQPNYNQNQLDLFNEGV